MCSGRVFEVTNLTYYNSRAYFVSEKSNVYDGIWLRTSGIVNQRSNNWVISANAENGYRPDTVHIR